MSICGWLSGGMTNDPIWAWDRRTHWEVHHNHTTESDNNTSKYHTSTHINTHTYIYMCVYVHISTYTEHTHTYTNSRNSKDCPFKQAHLQVHGRLPRSVGAAKIHVIIHPSAPTGHPRTHRIGQVKCTARSVWGSPCVIPSCVRVRESKWESVRVCVS